MDSKKEYRNSVRSKNLIRSAFLDLLGEKNLEKITATDIIKRADINRSTFYAHYPDARGLLDEILGRCPPPEQRSPAAGRSARAGCA